MKLSRLGVVLGSILALGVGYRAVDAQIERWSTTPGSNNASPPHGAPEGMAPSAVNDTMRQMMAETARYVKQAIAGKFGIAGGSVDAILVTPAITWNSYVSGQVLRFVSTGANTSSAPTVNVGGLGAVTVAKISNQALAAGDIPDRAMVEMVYHGGLGGFVLRPTATTPAANSVDGTMIALGSDAQGDIMYYDGTNWVRLAAGISGQVLATRGSGNNPAWITAPTFRSALWAHEQNSGTNGGSTSSGAWTAAPLNTEVYDEDNIGTVAGNKLSLNAGTYELSAWQTFCSVANDIGARARVRNISDGSTIGQGLNVSASDAGSPCTISTVPPTVFTITWARFIELQYYTDTATANVGLGASLSTGDAERYGAIHVRRLH